MCRDNLSIHRRGLPLPVPITPLYRSVFPAPPPSPAARHILVPPRIRRGVATCSHTSTLPPEPELRGRDRILNMMCLSTIYIHNFWLPGNLFHRIEPFTRLIDKTKVPSVPQCGSTWCGVEIVPRCELFTCRVPSSAQPSPSYQEYPRTARTESLLTIFPN